LIWVVLCCLRLSYFELFEVRLGWVALSCLRVGCIGFFQSAPRAG